MYTDREEFEGWMERIMERFDRTEKLLERVLKKNNTLDGEEVLDNQDLCLVHEFSRTRFAEVEERAAKRKEKEARKAERRKKRGLFP